MPSIVPPAGRLRAAIHVGACAALVAAGCARAKPAPAPTPAPAPSAPEPPCCVDATPFAPLRVAERNRVGALASRHVGPAELWSALGPMARAPGLRVAEIGRSVEGRPIRAFTAGAGPTAVLLWSQMHGDESTATMALADLLAWLGDTVPAPTAAEADTRARLTSALTIVMVPMLNPDGAVRDRRENASGVDVNRDARDLRTPEARALKALYDSLRPAFAFNLHDQSPRVLGEPGGRQVAVALLAPPTSDARTYDATRAAARLVAATIAGALEGEIPGRVARYDDTYNPRAFGDLMQQRGTSTVLIESGALPDDPEKQRLRALNVVAMLTALDAIADGRYRDADPRVYEALPVNGRAATDVLVRGGTLVMPGGAATRADLALEYDDPVAKRRPRLIVAGRLTHTVAIDTVDATGLYLHPAATMVLRDGGAYRLRLGAPAALTVASTRNPAGAVVRTIGERAPRPQAAARVAGQPPPP